MVDTLRATTTITVMLANGAEAVLPVATVDDARVAKARLAHALLVGERHNVPPPDFDGGNSPLEYSGDRVRGRKIVMTTTNGTQAVVRCQGAKAMALAALVNAAAATRWLQQAGCDGVIVMAGSEGRLALEDWLGAGAIVAGLTDWTWSDGARAAYWAWNQAKARLGEALLEATHGALLNAQGLGEDVRYAARVDLVETIGVRDGGGWFRNS